MPITRRQLLQRCLTASLFTWLLPACSRQQDPAPSLAATLRVYVDTLIPADETPSASQLDIDREILEKGSADENYQRVLGRGVAWLDQQARGLGSKDFISLKDSARVSVLTRADAAGIDTLEGIFFAVTLADAFMFYYARPESWHGLTEYQGPPQPHGYMDYYRPPGA